MNKSKAMRLVRKHSFLCDHKDDPRTVIDVDDVELIINAMPEESVWYVGDGTKDREVLCPLCGASQSQIAKRKIEEYCQYLEIETDAAIQSIYDWLERQ